MSGNVTTNFADFGARERDEAAKLFKAWDEQGLPDEFDDDGVTIAFNTLSGVIIITNGDYQVAMLNGKNLEMHYSCPYCGREGFLEELTSYHSGSVGERHPECNEWLRSIGVIEDGRPPGEEEGWIPEVW